MSSQHTCSHTTVPQLVCPAASTFKPPIEESQATPPAPISCSARRRGGTPCLPWHDGRCAPHHQRGGLASSLLRADTRPDWLGHGLGDLLLLLQQGQGEVPAGSRPAAAGGSNSRLADCSTTSLRVGTGFAGGAAAAAAGGSAAGAAGAAGAAAAAEPHAAPGQRGGGRSAGAC